jgi:hypothetical protein
MIYRRLRSNRTPIPKWLNVVRAISSEGFGRLKYNSTIRRLLDTDSAVRQFFDGETKVLPGFYEERIRRDLGPLWDMLPPGALFHDHSAYLKAHEAQTARAPAWLQAEQEIVDQLAACDENSSQEMTTRGRGVERTGTT